MKDFLEHALLYLGTVGIIFVVLKYFAGWNVTFFGCLIFITVFEIIGTIGPYILGLSVGLHFFRWLLGKND